MNFYNGFTFTCDIKIVINKKRLIFFLEKLRMYQILSAKFMYLINIYIELRKKYTDWLCAFENLVK